MREQILHAYSAVPFVENLISARQLSFVVDGMLQGPYFAFKSTSQGSTMSPLLFDLYLRLLGQHLHRDTRFLQYAVLFSTYRDLNVAIRSI